MGFYSIRSQVDYDNLSKFSRSTPSQGQQDYASAYLGGLEDDGVISTLGATAAFAIPDLIDTVSSSVGLSERGAINQQFLGAIGSPGVNAWFGQNRGAIEFGSGLAGAVISNVAARGILRPAGAAMTALRGVPYVRTIATLDAQFENARRLALLTQTRVAQAGATGIDRFVGSELIFARLGQSALVTSRGAATKGFINSSARRTLTQNLLTEGIMGATLNENSMLYDDSLTHNLMWTVGGLALGQAADSLISTHALRKMANADHIRQLNRGAYDVTGLETGRTDSFTVADSILSAAEPGLKPTMGFMFKGSGGTTDLVTSYAIQASELNLGRGTSQMAQTLSANRESAATQVMGIAQKLMQKVTPRGVRGAADSGFHMDTEGLGPVISESISRDPKSMMGIEEIGRIPEGLSAARVDGLRKQLFEMELKPAQELLAAGAKKVTKKTPTGKFMDEWIPLADEERQALRARVDELIFANSHQGKVMLEPGEWAPLSHAKIADNYTPIKPEFEGTLSAKDRRAFWTIKWGKRRTERLAIGDDGAFIWPEGKKTFAALSNSEMLHSYTAAKALVNHHVRHQIPFAVQPKATWMQLDIAEQIMQHKDGSPALVKWLNPKMTREQAMVESLAQKVDAVKGAAKDLDSLTPEQIYELKVRYNLPRVDSYTSALLNTDEHPLDLLLAGLQSGDEVREASHLDLLQTFNDARSIKGFTDETVPTLDSLSGNSFNFMKDRDGNPIGAIIGYQRPLNPFQWAKDDLLIRHAVRESLTQNELSGETADALTRELYGFLTSNPAFAKARNVMELADDQHRSFVPGFRNAAPQTPLGAAINAVTPRGRRDVDSLTLLAASQVQDLKSRFMQTATKEIFEGTMGDNISLINSPRNAKSAMLLNQTWSHGRGWAFVETPTQVNLPDGKKGYALVLDANNRENQRRFSEAFGREFEKGQPLMTPAGQIAVMDELAHDTFKRFQAVTNQVLSAKNTLLRSQGLPQIQNRPWYIPPPELKGKYVAYTFNANNEVVPGLTLIADTPEHLGWLKSEATASPLWRNGYRVRTKDDIGEYMSLWDKAQMDWHDPLTTALQPKKINRGNLAGPGIDHHAFAEGLVRMRDQLTQHGDEMIEVLFDQPLKSAKVRSELAKLETAQGVGKQKQHSSTYDRWTQNIRGQSALSANDSFFGDASRWLEDRVGGFLNSPPAQVPARIGQIFNDWTRAAVPGKSSSGKEFDQLAQALGKFMPYKSAAELVEAKLGSRPPKDVAELSAKLSWFEASHRLRWGESAHGVINLSSMIANMPSVIRALQPRVGETVAEAAARNSSITMAAKLPNGTEMVIPNGPKLVWASMMDAMFPGKRPLTPLRREAAARSYRLGYMNQEVAEMNESYAAIQNRDGWRGWALGNKQHQGNTAKDKFIRSGGLDKALGLLSDKSEDFSRQWGMHAGFIVGEAMGLTNPDDLVSLGHELTNKMIANYDPRNRPEVFQGALGSLFGLFQSYMFNFYGRMFRYVETKDGRALATQAAMQAGVFGMDSLPGWDALNYAFFDRGYAKGEDPVDSMYARFGTDTADLLMHGTLSNLPKLFGQDGIALYTRGDVSARIPGSQWTMLADTVPVPNLPVADTITRIWNGVTAGIGAARIDSADVGPNQWAEIASNTIVNRPLAGIIEQLGAGGMDTSLDGQVVARTQSTAESVYRWIGVRSMTQQKSVEAFYADKTAQEEQQGRRDDLNAATRGAIRGGRFEAVPRLFEAYVKNGGDPRRYTSWVKDAAKYALQTRSENRLAQALGDESNRSNATISRLLDGEVGIREGELSTEDYGRERAIEQVMASGWETAETPGLSLDADNTAAPPVQ